MGFVLSILYFVAYYLTPVTIFGPLAEFRIELILAALVTIVSLPKLSKSFLWKTPQTLALCGLAFATVLSGVFGMHYITGGVIFFLGFIPNALAYFLVCLHCDSKKKLQLVALMLLLVCLFVIVHGYIELRGAPADALSSPEAQDSSGSYLMVQGTLYRLKGLGEINDPNDFGQLVVCTIPLVFFFWTPGKALQNVGTVILPVGLLLFGAFLTHSRGSLLAILAMAVVVAQKRIRTIPALLLAGALYAAGVALNYTGGRDISSSAGEDRTDLWGSTMELLKEHTLFGVGYGNLSDYIGHTAHNSVLVCAAELGLIGLFFWCLFLFPTVRDSLTSASSAKASATEPAAAAEAPILPQAEERTGEIAEAEVKRFGRIMVLSLTGFLVAGWFLSRAYVVTLYLLGGMVEVIYEMALRQGMVVPRIALGRTLAYSGGLMISLLVGMDLLLRVVNLTH